MALDNAEFISELSILDPPGTDPLNQGDDHIRTTKKAVQQSFPNVGSAVPQTGAQMAQMAIKNEVNVFSQTNQFTARQDFVDANVRFDQIAGTRGLQWYVGGVQQWQLTNSIGSSLLRLRRYNAGVLVDDPIEVSNSTGLIITAEGFASGNLFQSAQVFFNDQNIRRLTSGGFARWRYQDELGQTQFETYINATTNDFFIQRRINGAFQDIPFTVVNATGQVRVGIGGASPGGLRVTGDLGSGDRGFSTFGDFGGHNYHSAAGVLRYQQFLFQSNNEINFAAFNSSGASVGTVQTIDLATRVVDFKVRPTVNGVPI